MENNENLQQLFDGSLHPKDILPFLSAEAGVEINAKDTLIIFDEIQAIPKALTALKFFCEEAPEYHIIAAGSTLGVTLHQSGSFPVGKVDFMSLFPMNFLEFLEAMGEEQLVELMKKQAGEKLNIFHDKLDKYLKQYYFVGGMPEVVASYTTEKNFTTVRTIQTRILTSYEQDFSKYASPLAATKLRMLYASIPHQVSKENKKFIYGIVKQGARARDYETTIQWLLDSGLVIKVNRVKTPKLPLKAYEDFGAFKLFVHDI
jgi:predicted AAA+ superfamily ATPase